MFGREVDNPSDMHHMKRFGGNADRIGTLLHNGPNALSNWLALCTSTNIRCRPNFGASARHSSLLPWSRMKQK
jgi:hypothetical protein